MNSDKCTLHIKGLPPVTAGTTTHFMHYQYLLYLALSLSSVFTADPEVKQRDDDDSGLVFGPIPFFNDHRRGRCGSYGRCTTTTTTATTVAYTLTTETVLVPMVCTGLSIFTTVTTKTGCPSFTILESTVLTSTTVSTTNTITSLTTTTFSSISLTTTTATSTFYTFTKPCRECHHHCRCRSHHRRPVRVPTRIEHFVPVYPSRGCISDDEDY